MTTGLQLALLAGALVGVGLLTVVWSLVPARVELRDVATRLSPQARQVPTRVSPDAHPGRYDTVGIWAQAHLPARIWNATPAQDLAILGKPLYRHRGEKILGAAIGLVAPPVIAALRVLTGQEAGVALPLLASLGLGVALFLLPDAQLKRRAADARLDFRRALVSYVDLVAMERRAGLGARRAMELAAEVGDAYAFTRIAKVLALSRYERRSAWDALEGLGQDIGVDELTSTAATMRSTGEQGSASYEALHSQSMLLRDALLNDTRAAATARARNTTFPIIGLAMLFIVALVYPMLTQLLSV